MKEVDLQAGGGGGAAPRLARLRWNEGSGGRRVAGSERRGWAAAGKGARAAGGFGRGGAGACGRRGGRGVRSVRLSVRWGSVGFFAVRKNKVLGSKKREGKGQPEVHQKTRKEVLLFKGSILFSQSVSCPGSAALYVAAVISCFSLSKAEMGEKQ